jgi:thiamine phosphate synthase YjbQ (UPF0047 family)
LRSGARRINGDDGRPKLLCGTHQYWHNRTGEDNADASLKRQVMGREVLAVINGWLDFGLWEQIFYGEFDGRQKRVLVKVIGEERCSELCCAVSLQ